MVIQTGRVGWTALTLALALLAAGCASEPASPASPAANPSTPGGTPVAVAVRNMAFTPASVTVPRGGLVAWTFEDGGIPHTVTADDNGFGSTPDGLTSGSFRQVFGTAGTFAYHCDFHPQMRGTITVR